MAEGRCKERWRHTSSMLALHANINRDSKKRASPFTPDDFNPYSAVGKRDTIQLGKQGVQALRCFVKDKKNGRRR